MTTSLLHVKGLRKELGNFELGPIDLEIEKGTIVGLVGQNGSGKSTFFRVLMQLLQPDEGKVVFFGYAQDNEVEWKQKIGFVGDIFEPFGHLTIMELASLISDWYPSWNHQRFSHLIHRYKINEKEKFGKCSTGTKKKVEFIFSLSHDSSLLILDEPTAGVDISSKRKMKEDLIGYMEDGERSIVLATHMIDEINELCDYITVLDAGKIVHSFNKDVAYENWTRVWLSDMPNHLSNHPNVVSFDVHLNQIVTDNLQILERALRQESIQVTHTSKLSLAEVLEFLMGHDA